TEPIDVDVDSEDDAPAEEDAPAAPKEEELTPEREPATKPAREVDIDVRTIQGDSMLARYFRDMAHHPVMGHEEEVAAAKGVESAEITHWMLLLGYLPAAPSMLLALREDIDATAKDEIDIAEIEQALKL